MMLSDSQRQLLQTKGVVLGRVLLGLLFFASGVDMLHAGMSTDFYVSLGLPMVALLVWLVMILKVVAGGALILGKRVGLAAAALAIFTLLTIPIAHWDLEDPNLFKNLAIVGGLLYVIAFGPGQCNVPKSTTSTNNEPTTAV